jgi:3-dehydroquinate synthase
MQEIFKIHSNTGDYSVEISQGGINKFIKNINSEHVVVDEKVYHLWPSLKISAPIFIKALEQNKTLLKTADLIESLREKNATRDSVMISIGGGITQDISTFCASSYMRGIKWHYAPTTLLGMVDSCIGGKSSINVGQFKNIAGNFFPPESIYIDVDFCKTLTEQQIIEGLFEAVKICYAHSEEKFDKYLSLVNLEKSLYDLNFNEIVKLSLKAKKHFIEEDEFDNGIRLLLNFGHTFGHAIEGAGNYSIPHGIAVGLGMLSAYELSLTLSLVDAHNRKVNRLISHVVNMLKRVDGLSLTIEALDMKVALQKFLSDKKHSNDFLVAILYDKDGNLIRKKIERSEDNMQLILEAFECLKRI